MIVVDWFRSVLITPKPDIRAGDLVEVVRKSSCCDNDAAIGYWFIVRECKEEPLQCSNCGTQAVTLRAYVQASDFGNESDSFPVTRLKLLKRQTNPVVLEQMEFNQRNQQGTKP
jgi:hypothetical protein